MSTPGEGVEHTIHFASTVACWRGEGDDAERVLGYKHPNAACQLALYIRLDTSTASASIKLRIPVGFKELRNKVNVFVVVHPECIESIEYGKAESIPAIVRGIFVQQQKCSDDGGIMRLLLRLARPSALLLPNLKSFAPSSISTGAVFELAQSLTASTLLELYLPSADAHTTCLDAMGTMLTPGLKFMASDVDPLRVYRGQGSRLVEAGHLVSIAGTPESPPSYDELGPTPPPPDVEERPQKRARKEAVGVPRHDEEEQLARTRAYLLREVRKEIGEQVAQMEQRIQARVQATCEENKAEILERLVQLSQQVNQLEDNAKKQSRPAGEKSPEILTQDEADEYKQNNDLDDLREEMNERLGNLDATVFELNEDTKDELSELIDIRFDERVLDIKCELQDYIREELQDVEGRIKNELHEATITIDF